MISLSFYSYPIEYTRATVCFDEDEKAKTAAAQKGTVIAWSNALETENKAAAASERPNENKPNRDSGRNDLVTKDDTYIKNLSIISFTSNDLRTERNSEDREPPLLESIFQLETRTKSNKKIKRWHWER